MRVQAVRGSEDIAVISGPIDGRPSAFLLMSKNLDPYIQVPFQKVSGSFLNSLRKLNLSLGGPMDFFISSFYAYLCNFKSISFVRPDGYVQYPCEGTTNFARKSYTGESLEEGPWTKTCKKEEGKRKEETGSCKQERSKRDGSLEVW